MDGRLSEPADLKSLRSLFQAKRDDVATLGWINDQLKLRTDDAANVLQVEVVTALRKVRKSDAVDAVLAKVGIKTPDGRPLHRYRMSDDTYEALKGYVRRGLRQSALVEDARGPQHFVVFVAEWFRREYAGGQQRWEDVAAALDAPLPYPDTKPLTRNGLRWWRRTLRVVNGVEERLLSLALEGGFPIRVFESEQGWLLDHLRRAVGRLSAEPAEDEDAALSAVEAVEHRIPVSFRGGEFQRLSAELVLAVAALRRQAQQLEPRGLPLSVRLEAARPEWREDLPIALEGEGARKLVDELISTAPDRLSGEAKCRRLLLFADGWRPALELSLGGELWRVPEVLRGHEGRVRVSAAGALSAGLAGEIALLEPPDGDGSWLARSRGAAKRVLEPFPFEAPVEVELRRDRCAPLATTWPRGEPERGELLVFAEADDTLRPGALVFVGPGSCRSRQPVLYGWAPGVFEARTLGGASIAPVWLGSCRSLFRLEEAARLGAPGAEYAYRIEPGANSERVERLWIEGDTFRGLRENEGRPIYSGQPRIRGRSNGAFRDVENELSWRRRGETAWRSMRDPMEGPIDVIWRDSSSRSLRDRASLVVMPPGARLSRRPLADLSARLMLEAAAGWALECPPDAKLRSQPLKGGLEVSFVGAPERTVGLHLVHAQFGEFAGRAVVPFLRGGFASSDDQVFRQGRRVMIDALRGARAFAPGRGTLTLELHGRPSSRQLLSFEEEMPLARVADDVARVLSGAADLDTDVVLTVEPGGASLCVGRYVGEVDFDRQQRTVSVRGLHDAVGQIRYEWRSFTDPSPAGLRLVCEREGLGGGPAPLPDDMVGPGLVLLRVNGTPLARPKPVSGAPISTDGLNPLVSASVLVGHKERQTAILAALEAVGSKPWSSSALRWMHAMLEALDGVPPIALDAFRLLWLKPAAAAALLLSAEGDAERERAWRLEQSTQVIWVLTPLEAWRTALTGRLAHFEELLTMAGLPSASALALEQVRREGESLAALDPLLRAPLAAVGACKAEPVTRSHFEIAQERVRRSALEVDRTRQQDRAWPDCFYQDETLRPELPAFFHHRDRLHAAHWEGLEAPCAAALRATERVKLTLDQRFRIRAAMSEDPLHFAESYGAFVAEFAAEESSRAS